MNDGRLFLTEQIRRLEGRAASPGIPPLMELAGRAAARLAQTLARDTNLPILVVAGPGNNGGDAWVAAARLREAFHAVTVFDVTGAEPRDGVAREAKKALAAAGGNIVRAWPERLAAALVIDGLLGIGVARPVEGLFAEVIARINADGVPTLALDIPSGIDADTGAASGPAVQATATITFLGLKPGLFTGDGLACAGKVHLDTLGLPSDERETPLGTLVTPGLVASWLPSRARNTHKGSFGTLGIVGGNKGMVGAALLAARAALFTGAGRVYVGLLTPDAPAFDPAAAELMLRPVDDALAAEVIVAGPGAGLSPSATTRSAFERSVLPAAIAATKPLVLDADALNAVATLPGLTQALALRRIPAILTPHPGEAARLLAETTARIQADRIGSAVAIARRFNAHVVLKGAGSVCATPDGRWAINTTGNPGLASGGTGDVLAGIIGALLCQGLSSEQALQYGVCLHGAAADQCVARGIGPVGLTASDVILEARALINAWATGAS